MMKLISLVDFGLKEKYTGKSTNATLYLDFQRIRLNDNV